jgi:hypothetical protein
MVKRKIVWTETAVKQRRLVLKYWTDRNKSNLYAIKLIKVIASHLHIISKSPAAFKETEIPNIREAAMGHFSLYYKFTTDEIIVMAFWDNRQEPHKLLALIK